MSPMEIELIRTVGMMNDTYFEVYQWKTRETQKKGMSKLPVDERTDDIEKYRRHKQRHHRKPMRGKCKTRSGWDRYNNKENLKILGARSQGQTQRISADKQKGPQTPFRSRNYLN